MQTRTTIGHGTYPTCTFHGTELWASWHDGASLVLASFELTSLLETFRTSWFVGEPTVFPDLTSTRGQLFLSYREGTAPYLAVLQNVGTSAREFLDDRGDGPDQAHGEQPIKFGGDDIAWQSSGNPTWDVWRRPIAGGKPQRVRTGVGTGLSRVLPDRVTTIDEDRGALPGYTRPSWAGDLVVAEGPNGGTFCRLQDGRELLLWPGRDAKTPRCTVAGERLGVIAWGRQGMSLAVLERSDFAQPGAVPLAPLGRPAFIGGFYVTTDKYPESIANYPQNIEVIVEASAVARATRPVILSPDALAGVAHAQRVIGLYVAAEEEGQNTASHLDIRAELARAAWRERFHDHPVPAVVGYLTRGMVARPTWPPRSIDVFAPECYFDLNATPSAAGVEALVAGWAHVLSATRPWLLTSQGYDRNGVMRDRMDALAAASPAYLEAMRARPWILGLLWFAVQRPGGVRDYPALLAAHRRIFAAVPGAPASLPVASPLIPPPDPGESDVIRIAVGTYDRTASAGDGAGIRFELQSDVPVTSLTVDFLGDGKDGVTFSSTDMRRLLGVTVAAPNKSGTFQWQLTATNARGERDQTGSSRSITVQE